MRARKRLVLPTKVPLLRIFNDAIGQIRSSCFVELFTVEFRVKLDRLTVIFHRN